LFALLITLIAGATLPLAFAPFHLPFFAYIAPAFLLYFLINTTSLKQAFFRGLCFGIGFFGVGASWIFVSVNTYGNTPLFISLIVTALFVLILSLYIALQSVIVTLGNRKASTAATCLIIFPLTWLLFEWLRGTLFTGFPWLYLGYSQIDTPLRWLAPYISVYGLSFLTVLISGCLIALGYEKKIWIKTLCATIIVCSLVAGWSLKQRVIDHAEKKLPLKVTLVQGNIPNQMKWDPAYFAKIINIYSKLSFANWSSQLILWPEGAMVLNAVIAMRGLDAARLPRRTAWPSGHWDWPVHLPYRHGLICGDLVFLGG